MTQIYSPEVYAVRIPLALKQPFEELELAPSDYLVLETLATKLPLEDVFYFVTEQTTNAEYVKYVTDGGLLSFLRHPINISWMASVKTQYDKYIEQRQHREQTDYVSSSLPPRIWCNHITSMVSNGTDAKLPLVIKFDENETGTDERTFKMNLVYQVTHLFGYATTHTHPVMKLLLRKD